MSTTDSYVFITYSRADATYAGQLTEFLRGRGIPVWVDTSSIQSGARWSRAIRDAIANAVAVIVLMTQDAEESRQVENEIIYAESMGVMRFPLLLDGNPFFHLVSIQYNDVRDGSMPPPGEFVARLRELLTL